MRNQIKKTGKDSHFGAERSLYTLQQQLLDIAGPLTCLWADLADDNAKVDPQATIHLVQSSSVVSPGKCLPFDNTEKEESGLVENQSVQCKPAAGR